jgi:hypothetical protein
MGERRLRSNKLCQDSNQSLGAQNSFSTLSLFLSDFSRVADLNREDCTGSSGGPEDLLGSDNLLSP